VSVTHSRRRLSALFTCRPRLARLQAIVGMPSTAAARLQTETLAGPEKSTE